jgi:hypothetical protein
MFCFPLCGRGKECRLPLPTVDECGRPGNCNRPDLRKGEHIAKLTDLESAGMLPVLPAHWHDWRKLYALAKRVFPRDEYRQTDLVSKTFLRCFKKRDSVCSAKRLIVTFWQLTRKLRRKDAHQNTQQIENLQSMQETVSISRDEMLTDFNTSSNREIHNGRSRTDSQQA